MTPIGRQSTHPPSASTTSLQALYQRICKVFQRSSSVSPILTTSNPRQRPVFGRDTALEEYGRMRNEAFNRAFRSQVSQIIPGTEETDSESSF